MASAIIPPFQETPLASISATHDLLRTTFYTGKTKSIDFRVKQLRKLYWGSVIHEIFYSEFRANLVTE